MLTERVWERVKAAARRNAAEGVRLGFQDSKRVVKGIALGTDGPLPQEAIEFYARELIRLTAEAAGAAE